MAPLGAAQAHRPEIIFLDLSSGILEQLNVLRDVRQAIEQPGLPSIVLATSDAIELERRGLGLSAAITPAGAQIQPAPEKPAQPKAGPPAPTQTVSPRPKPTPSAVLH